MADEKQERWDERVCERGQCASRDPRPFFGRCIGIVGSPGPVAVASAVAMCGFAANDVGGFTRVLGDVSLAAM